MKNIDLMKQELHTYIDELNPRELYLLDSVFRDSWQEIGKDINHLFYCDKCEELFGQCAVDSGDKECCVNRFRMYCDIDAE